MKRRKNEKIQYISSGDEHHVGRCEKSGFAVDVYTVENWPKESEEVEPIVLILDEEHATAFWRFDRMESKLGDPTLSDSPVEAVEEVMREMLIKSWKIAHRELETGAGG